jgi:hypothetical protein
MLHYKSKTFSAIISLNVHKLIIFFLHILAHLLLSQKMIEDSPTTMHGAQLVKYCLPQESLVYSEDDLNRLVY